MSSSATITDALADLGLLVIDDVDELQSGAARDRAWVFEMDGHIDADDLVPQRGRLTSAFALAGRYELHADDVDELRAADDVQAIALALPVAGVGPAQVLELPDRGIVQSDITAEAVLSITFINDSGPGGRRDAITDAIRALQLELADPARCTGRPGLDRLGLAQADAREADDGVVQVECVIRASWRPGAGGSWGIARPALIEAAERAGLVVLNDAGKPATTDARITGRAQLRLRRLANARFVFDDAAHLLLVEQTFDIVQEAT